VFCAAAFLPVRELKVVDALAYFFYWLGISIGMHAIPSTVDLSHLWKAAPALAKKGFSWQFSACRFAPSW